MLPMNGACPVCHSRDVSQAFVKHEIPYFKCGECGFGFSTPPGNANLDNTLHDFEDVYLRYLEPDRADEKNFSGLLRWMARFAAIEGATFLDVGCGSGKLVRHLRRHSIDACGLEPSAALYEHFLANEPYFFHGTLDDFARAHGRTFDIVAAFDVIEHVPDPAHLLHGLGTVVREGGTIFLSTPDAGSPAAKLLGRWWHHYNHYHLSYLSRPVVERMARREGLEPLHCSRRGRYRSVGYAIEHGLNFVCGVSRPGVVRYLDRVYLPINTFDIMHQALRKRSCGG